MAQGSALLSGHAHLGSLCSQRRAGTSSSLAAWRLALMLPRPGQRLVQVASLARGPVQGPCVQLRAEAGQWQGRCKVPDSAIKRRLLIAVDDSEDSEMACQWALDNLYRQGDCLHLLHVIPFLPQRAVFSYPQGIPDGALLTPPLVPELNKTLSDLECAKITGRCAAMMEAAGVAYQVELLREFGEEPFESVGETICARATALEAAAVVVASHSKGPLAEFLLGSVANHLTHHCHRPVLVLHRSTHAAAAAAAAGTRPGREQALVVAVDDSPASEAACDWALQHIWRPGDVIHLLHVLPAPPVGMFHFVGNDGMLYNMVPEAVTQVAQGDLDHAKDFVARRFLAKLEAAGVAHEVDLVSEYPVAELMPPVGEVILDKAAALRARVVVMGHQPRSAMVEFLLGSTVNFCTHNAQQPIAVLHYSRRR